MEGDDDNINSNIKFLNRQSKTLCTCRRKNKVGKLKLTNLCLLCNCEMNTKIITKRS